MAGRSLKGKLLVATPLLGDPNFFGTVVLVLDHGDGGALGVVLNRPSEVVVGLTLSRWDGVASEPGVVFIGGPVSRESAMALATIERVTIEEAGIEEGEVDNVGVEDPEEGEGWRVVLGGVAIVDLRGDPHDLWPGGLEESGVRGLRVFSGHAAWGAGQLESELNSGAWVVTESEPGDVVTRAPSGLWYTAMKRADGQTSSTAGLN